MFLGHSVCTVWLLRAIVMSVCNTCIVAKQYIQLHTTAFLSASL